jgi:hypothetical protein
MLSENVAAALDRKRQADMAQLRHNLSQSEERAENTQQQDARIQ